MVFKSLNNNLNISKAPFYGHEKFDLGLCCPDDCCLNKNHMAKVDY